MLQKVCWLTAILLFIVEDDNIKSWIDKAVNDISIVLHKLKPTDKVGSSLKNHLKNSPQNKVSNLKDEEKDLTSKLKK